MLVGAKIFGLFILEGLKYLGSRLRKNTGSPPTPLKVNDRSLMANISTSRASLFQGQC